MPRPQGYLFEGAKNIDFISKWPPEHYLTLRDNKKSEMLNFVLKQNPKCATSVDKNKTELSFTVCL